MQGPYLCSKVVLPREVINHNKKERKIIWKAELTLALEILYIYQQFSTQNILNRIGDLRSFFSWVEILGNTNQILECYLEYM